jgi:hypothetical protein
MVIYILCSYAAYCAFMKYMHWVNVYTEVVFVRLSISLISEITEGILPGEIEENHEKSRSEWLVIRLRSKPDTFWRQLV